MYVSKIFVTVDCLVFKEINHFLHILLVQRKNDPFKDNWALPGGFVDENEDLEAAARRELLEETGVKAGAINQLGAFGTPFRDPRSHVVSIAYYGFVDSQTQAEAADDAKEVGWFSVNDLPLLAFDHKEIINLALTRI